MITNIICVIASILVTNTTERLPTHSVTIPCPEGILTCVVQHTKQEPDLNPTFKTITESVTEKTTYSFNIDGHEKCVTEQKDVRVTETVLTKAPPQWTPFKTNLVLWIDEHGIVNQSNGFNWRMEVNYPNQIIHSAPHWRAQ